MATYLDFEQKIKNLQDDIESALMRGDDDAKLILEKELEKEVRNVYSNISDYQNYSSHATLTVPMLWIILSLFVKILMK